MKQEVFYITSPEKQAEAVTAVVKLSLDDKVKVTISSAKDKSVRQRGLQWKWYTEVSQAGIGGKHEDTKEGVHSLSKWAWALPIFIRDDDFFSELWTAWTVSHKDNKEAMRWFIDTQVHTEKFNTAQMGEFLDDFQKHYSPHVALTDPKEFDLA
jgi:hypothetical protein